jgi:cell division protein FtsI/penicillin-binding protein 2
MKTIADKKVRQRTILLSCGFILWAAVISVRLFDLQVVHHAQLKSEVLGQNQDDRPIPPKRGTIYDRNGKTLAESLPVQSVFLLARKNESPSAQLEKVKSLKKILDLSTAEIQRIRERIIKKEKSFTWLKRKVDDETARKVKELNLSGVFLQDENRRSYPQGTLAAHVLGGVDIDNVGLGGIEHRYNRALRGEAGKSRIFTDARQREYQIEILEPAQAGRDISLTIDETIQYIAERELEKAVTANSANWGTVIVSKPSTGEILALANSPAYNPNDGLPSEDQGRNRAIQDIFEPGSTFKIVTASVARETNLVRLTDYFDCRKGSILVGRSYVRDHKLFGILSFPQVLIHSSNVGTIQIAKRLRDETFYGMIRAYHFGEKTGIELPGEESGILWPLKNWNRLSSLPHIAIGYEISVTALQMLQAMNVIANRGRLSHPRIVKEISGLPGVIEKGPLQEEKIISLQTAAELIEIFKGVVEEGTGTAARIPGYEIAGKTGTAQKIDPATRAYTSAKHLASFVGFVPADNPVLSMIVVLDEPKLGDHYGGQVAAPIFREIARRSLLYLHVAPNKINPELVVTAQLQDNQR